MALNIIAAIGRNNELGKDNDLIWKISDDMKFFRQKTMGYDIIMGRKTYESLPNILQGRKNIILTKREEIIPGAVVYSTIEDLINKYEKKDAFIIGGESLYRQFLEYVKKMYLTLIDDECPEADTFFPSFDENDFEKTILDEKYDEKLGVNYQHVLYKRR